MKGILCYFILASLGAGLARTPAQANEGKTPKDLDAVLKVEVSTKLVISLRFGLPGKADQSFYSREYRYAVLDKDGVQVDGALMTNGAAFHTLAVPKGNPFVTDYSEVMFNPKRLKSGEEYYLAVSIRNLTGLAKFKAP